MESDLLTADQFVSAEALHFACVSLRIKHKGVT